MVQSTHAFGASLKQSLAAPSKKPRLAAPSKKKPSAGGGWALGTHWADTARRSGVWCRFCKGTGGKESADPQAHAYIAVRGVV